MMVGNYKKYLDISNQIMVLCVISLHCPPPWGISAT
jgi:hypothetical protein